MLCYSFFCVWRNYMYMKLSVGYCKAEPLSLWHSAALPVSHAGQVFLKSYSMWQSTLCISVNTDFCTQCAVSFVIHEIMKLAAMSLGQHNRNYITQLFLVLLINSTWLMGVIMCYWWNHTNTYWKQILLSCK